MAQFDLSFNNDNVAVTHDLSAQRSEKMRTPWEYGTPQTDIAEGIDGVEPEDGMSVEEGFGGAVGITYDLTYVFPDFSYEEPHPKEYTIIWDGNDMGSVKATSKHGALDVLAFDSGWDNMEQLRFSEEPVKERSYFYSQFKFV